MKRRDKVCVTCGTAFVMYGAGNKEYCNPSCRTSKFRRMPLSKVSCERCKTVFMPTRITRGGKQRFCSGRCCREAYKAKRRSQPKLPRKVIPRSAIPPVIYSKSTRECRKCSARFEAFSYENRVFCSRRCSKSYYNKVRSRHKTDGKTLGLFEANGCAICGYTRRVDRAHILPARDGWPAVPWNLIPLCPNHHTAYDDGKLTQSELDALGIGWLAA